CTSDQRECQTCPTRRSTDLVAEEIVLRNGKLDAHQQRQQAACQEEHECREHVPPAHRLLVHRGERVPSRPRGPGALLLAFQLLRSEEHTSELQSREKLVCRL